MRQQDGVTPQRLENRVQDTEAATRETQRRLDALRAANEHLRDIETRLQATVVNKRPNGEVPSQTTADAGVAVPQVSDFQDSLAQVVRSRDTLVAQLNQVVQALDRAEQDRAADATAAAQRLAQQEAELAAAKAEAATLSESLKRQLANAYDREADAKEAAERLTRRETEVAAVVEAHQSLERRFSAALTLLQEQDADLEATNKRLTTRDAELAEATETRLSLERQLAGAESALGEAVRRSAADRSTAIQEAAQRQSEFDAVLKEKVAKYDTLARDLSAARQQLAHAETTLRETEARHALAMTTAAAQRNEQEARHEARMAEAAAARDAVSRQLLEATSALDSSRQDHQADRTTAAERLAQQEATLREETAARQMLERQLAGARATRETLEQALTVAGNKVAEAETAIRDAEQRHDAHITTVTARFADQQVQYETRLAEAVAARDLVDQRLRQVEASFERSRGERAADAATAAERFARLEAQRVEALANLQMLEGQLADAKAALKVAEESMATERLNAERQAAQRQTEFEATIVRETAGRHAVEQDLATAQQKLAESESALRNAEQRHASEMKTAAGQFAAQLTQLESELAKATANGETLERRLAEVTNALHTAEALVVSERVASEVRATERQVDFDARLSLELGTRNTIEQALAATRKDLLQTEATLRDATAQHIEEITALEQKLADADQRHASALKAAATRLTEQQSEYETRLAEVGTARETVSQQLRDTETTLARIRQESDANASASADRLSQRESELAAASTARQVLERRLVDTETALKDAEARALAERTAAMQQSARRRAEFDAQLAREVEARNVVERDLAENRVAAEQTRQALLGQSAALTTQLRELEVRLTQELARERAEYEGKLADLRQAKEIELQRLGDDYARVLQTLDQVRADALQKLERMGSEHTAELVRINAVVAERDGRITDQAARHALSQEAAQQALAKLENELRATVAAHRQQVEQLQSGLKTVTQDFEKTRSHRDRLQIEADRVPQLMNQLEASRAESARQFDGSPIGILRCSDAGVLKEANQALITALGYRTVDQLRALGSTASVFESPDDFRWLIDHCERTPSESVDCIWKKKDGSRLTMRLRALRRSADVVELVAEDLTTLRAVEERLRQAQRMEAVGRLASEVADTCDILLRNVSQDGQQWLAAVGSNSAQRHQGELILGEVTRAANFLKQLSVYGEKQTRALAGVDVNTVLRDLAPVMKRVAGDFIELVLPKKILALNVDVDAALVERVLVNIAAYGRARMPSGGRLIIDLARVVLDLDFRTKYPNVRQGAHALISVAEVRTAAPAEPIGIRETGEATTIAATSERPGVDLVALQALIGDCGGHLWMKAEPGGDMEVKIHLPLRAANTSRSAGVLSSARERLASSWFQS